MIPGEYFYDGPDLEINAGRSTGKIKVTNTGDRPIQVGSHFHFFEVNRALVFDREKAYGKRLDLLSGTAIRFEPGDVKEVQLVDLAGERKVYGLNGVVMGQLDDPTVRKAAFKRLMDGNSGNQPGSNLKTGQDHGETRHRV